MENSKKMDPGWNDPPILNYSASNPPPKSRITNKRVAFPLSGQAVAQVEGNKPPITLIPQINENFCQQDLFNSTVANLEKILSKIDNKDVTDQVNVMKTMWAEGKFTQNVQARIAELVQCVTDENHKKANELHLKLTMEASNVSGSWISALKLIIK